MKKHQKTKPTKKMKPQKKQKMKTKISKSKPVKMKTPKINLRTQTPSTWCPGCFNFQILAGVQKFIENQITAGKQKEDFAIVTGIGCHAKIFDYLDLPGINSLHGRVLPTCLGIKIAKPELNVIGFSGDGDAYAEGMEHLIHNARYNSNIKYLVHNNQVFALTVAEPTPVTEKGYRDKTTPRGVKLAPINPIKLMLASGASFVARVFADSEQINQVLEEAFKHKGFSFIEILQPCIIFHNDAGYKERTYNIQETGHDKTNMNAAMQKAEEFDYNSKIGKIPLGIFYQKEMNVFEEVLRK
jgi:2-oxoglutarate ferredoxin oxidoreductase subunit beta